MPPILVTGLFDLTTLQLSLPIMQFSFVSLAVLGLFATVRGDVHQLIVGTFGTESLYTLEFDDVALTMDLIGNYTASAASSWIALSVSTESSCTIYY